MQWYWIILIIILSGFLFLKIVDLLFGRKPKNLGVKDGKLAPMPQTPKGVNSYTDYDPQKMEPIPYMGDTKLAVDQMVSILKKLEDYPRITFYEINPDYIWARDISRFWRWKDDIEFYFDKKNHLIHFRSNPRYGYTDGGFNRKRMEIIKEKFINVNHTK